ncbi:hypothetical protein, partial [Leptospira barantonii]
MKRIRYFLPGILVLFFESCTIDTSGCEKNCDNQLSTCLLVAVNTGTANQSIAIPFVCYQICENCKDNCRVRTSSGSSGGPSARTGGGSGGRSGGGGGHSSGGGG